MFARTPRIGTVMAAFLRRTWLERKLEWLAVGIRLAGMTIAILSYSFLGRFVDAAPNPTLESYRGRYGLYLIIGMAALDLQTSLMSALASSIRNAQITGALESLLSTPTPIALVLWGASIPDLLGLVVRLVFYSAMGALFFSSGGTLLTWSLAGGVLAMLIAAILALSALGIIGAALTLMLRRSDPLQVLLATLSMIAGGVVYPRAILPPALSALGSCLPITHVLTGLRAAIVGQSWSAAFAHLMLMTLILGPLGVWLFSRALKRAREDGSLTAF